MIHLYSLDLLKGRGRRKEIHNNTFPKYCFYKLVDDFWCTGRLCVCVRVCVYVVMEINLCNFL